MILHDYRCQECALVEERFVNVDETQVECAACGAVANRVTLTAPKPDWAGLAMGANASPEAIKRFERTHTQQRDKELKHKREHGDYGPAPGSDGGNGYSV